MGMHEWEVQGISGHYAINGLISNNVGVVESYNMLMVFRRLELNYLVILPCWWNIIYFINYIHCKWDISFLKAALVQYLTTKKSTKLIQPYIKWGEVDSELLHE